MLEVFRVNGVISLSDYDDSKTWYALWSLICASSNLECLMCVFVRVCMCVCVREKERVLARVHSIYGYFV